MSSQANELAARVKAFADCVIRFVRDLPPEPRIENVLKQLVDSSSAASRIIAPPVVRKEFVAKLGLVAEEADESEHWLELLTSAGVVDTPAQAQEMASLLAEARELRAIFVQSFQTGQGQLRTHVR